MVGMYWCYIGKRRPEKAIAEIDAQHDVQIQLHPFQLYPTMPKEGVSRNEYPRCGSNGSNSSIRIIQRVLTSENRTIQPWGCHLEFPSPH